MPGLARLPPLPVIIAKVFRAKTLGPDLGVWIWTFGRGKVTWWVDGLAVRAGLEARAASSVEEVDDDKAEDNVEGSAAVVADAGTHVVAAAPDQEQEDYENEDERHAGV